MLLQVIEFAGGSRRHHDKGDYYATEIEIADLDRLMKTKFFKAITSNTAPSKSTTSSKVGKEDKGKMGKQSKEGKQRQGKAKQMHLAKKSEESEDLSLENYVSLDSMKSKVLCAHVCVFHPFM